MICGSPIGALRMRTYSPGSVREISATEQPVGALEQAFGVGPRQRALG